jgi:branched-chain amino acid transport system ATP-binding protein
MSESTPLLEVDNLTVAYGPAVAIREVSLKVGEGQVIAVVGPNGAGKTTLLHTISGLLNPLKGTVRFQGNDVTNVSAFKRMYLGLIQIPERRQLFGEMTVMENLDMGAFSVRVDPELKKRNLERVFKLFPRLEERTQQRAKTLSGGEGQMLAVGRGLMATPKCLMMDEPSLGLAPMLKDQVYDVVEELRKEVTILIVEQDVSFVLDICDYGYVIEGGQITAQGTREELQKIDLVQAYLGI